MKFEIKPIKESSFKPFRLTLDVEVSDKNSFDNLLEAVDMASDKNVDFMELYLALCNMNALMEDETDE